MPKESSTRSSKIVPTINLLSKGKPTPKDAVYYREFLNELPTGLRTTAIAWIGIVTKPLAIDFNWRRERGFEHFLNDMGQRPEKAILIRINDNKIYCKSNCMWINWREYSYMNKKIPASRFTHCRIIRVQE